MNSDKDTRLREEFFESKKNLKTRFIESLSMEYDYDSDSFKVRGKVICAYKFSKNPLETLQLAFYLNPQIMHEISKVVLAHAEYRPIEVFSYTFGRKL